MTSRKLQDPLVCWGPQPVLVWGQNGAPSSISTLQETAHKHLMCQRQACEAQTPEPLRRHRSLMAHSLLPLAEKQRRVLRNLRRLEGLGLVSASNGYQGLVDELAKVMTWVCVLCVYMHGLVCVREYACTRLYVHTPEYLHTYMGGSMSRPVPGECHPKLSPTRGRTVILFNEKVLNLGREGNVLTTFLLKKK